MYGPSIPLYLALNAAGSYRGIRPNLRPDVSAPCTKADSDHIET
jgi:hypothetical protein